MQKNASFQLSVFWNLTGILSQTFLSSVISFLLKLPSASPRNQAPCFWLVEFESPAVLAATAIMSSPLIFSSPSAQQLFCMANESEPVVTSDIYVDT